MGSLIPSKLKDVNMNPKLSLQNGVRTEIQEKIKTKKHELSKIIHYLCRVLAKTAKMNLKYRKILNWETINPDSAVNSALYISKSYYWSLCVYCVCWHCR
jgi:hypothetical protein